MFDTICNVYRRRLEYGLLHDPTSEISDEDLLSHIQQIHQDTTYSGVQMVCGSLRPKGVKVTRERVHNILRSTDPFGSARRWPLGLVRRQPYFVAGPNSLWHIGNYYELNCVHHNCFQ